MIVNTAAHRDPQFSPEHLPAFRGAITPFHSSLAISHSPLATVLCFQSLTNCPRFATHSQPLSFQPITNRPVCKSFVLITMQKCRGWVGPLCSTFPTCKPFNLPCLRNPFNCNTYERPPRFAVFWPKSPSCNSFIRITYKNRLRNPFIRNTYKNTGGGGAAPPRFLSYRKNWGIGLASHARLRLPEHARSAPAPCAHLH